MKEVTQTQFNSVARLLEVCEVEQTLEAVLEGFSQSSYKGVLSETGRIIEEALLEINKVISEAHEELIINEGE